LHGDELDIVAENDIEVVGAESVKRYVDAFGDPFGREIEVLEVVATEFGAEGVMIAWDAPKRDAEQDFAHAAAVEGRGIDEVEPGVERRADALECVV